MASHGLFHRGLLNTFAEFRGYTKAQKVHQSQFGDLAGILSQEYADRVSAQHVTPVAGGHGSKRLGKAGLRGRGGSA